MLEARIQQSASSLPVEINLTDPDGFSDDMSEDLASFSDNVPLPPAPSCFVSDGHFASSGPLSLRLAVLLSAHTLAVMCDRLGPGVFPVSGLPRLQLSVPFLLWTSSTSNTCAAFTTWRLLQA